MYKLVDCAIPKNVWGYKTISSDECKEGLKAVKLYLYNEPSFRNVCVPSRKRVLKINNTLEVKELEMILIPMIIVVLIAKILV